MDLASLETKEEEELILEQIKIIFDTKKRFFIGGTNMGSETSSWYWENTGKSINYDMRWAPNEPNEGPEKCLEIYNVHGSWSLNNVWCRSEQNFICEKIIDDEDC